MNGEPKDLVIRPPVKLLLAVVLVGGLFYVLGQYVGSGAQRVEQELQAGREVSVEGTGEADAKPDVAKLTLGVATGTQPTAKAALDLLSRRFAAVVGALKTAGVKDEDVQTSNLSISPQYDYAEGRQILRGFEAAESVEVKIRDLDRVGDVLAKATGEGVNQAGGIAFEIDDPAMLREEAERKAIEDARGRAERLAKALGARLGRVKKFTAEPTPPTAPPIFAERAVAVGGPGGPPVPPGTTTIRVTVAVTYELR